MVYGFGAAAECGQSRLRNNCGDKNSAQLPEGAPQQGTALAQERETPNSSTSGSTSRIISRCASSHGLATRGSLAGGARKPTRLFRRLKASSMRHRMRYKAKICSGGNSSAGSDVTRMTHSQA